jgi:hypothetical protein
MGYEYDLQQMIKHRLGDELTTSQSALVDEAREAGYKITSQRLSQLTRGDRTYVRVDTIRALAFILRVPIEEVCDAAWRSVGVDMPVRVRVDERDMSVRSDSDDSNPPTSEAPEMTLVLRVEGLSSEHLDRLIQTVADTARHCEQKITQSGRSQAAPTPI